MPTGIARHSEPLRLSEKLIESIEHWTASKAKCQFTKTAVPNFNRTVAAASGTNWNSTWPYCDRTLDSVLPLEKRIISASLWKSSMDRAVSSARLLMAAAWTSWKRSSYTHTLSLLNGLETNARTTKTHSSMFRFWNVTKLKNVSLFHSFQIHQTAQTK